MDTLIDYLKTNKPQGFAPRPHYSVEGDSLTFFFRDDPSHRERVDDFLTVYRSRKTNELVGCQIKGLPKALELLGSFGLMIEDDSVKLSMIFMACMAASPQQDAKMIYLQLGKVARDATIPADELQLSRS